MDNYLPIQRYQQKDHALRWIGIPLYYQIQLFLLYWVYLTAVFPKALRRSLSCHQGDSASKNQTTVNYKKIGGLSHVSLSNS